MPERASVTPAPANVSALRERDEIPLLLLLGAVAEDRAADEAAREGQRARDDVADARDLLDQQRVGDVVEAGAAVLGRDDAAREAELAGRARRSRPGSAPRGRTRRRAARSPARRSRARAGAARAARPSSRGPSGGRLCESRRPVRRPEYQPYCALADHHRRRVRVGRGDGRHHRRVGDAEALDAVARASDGSTTATLVDAHPARPDGVVDRARAVADVGRAARRAAHALGRVELVRRATRRARPARRSRGRSSSPLTIASTSTWQLQVRRVDHGRRPGSADARRTVPRLAGRDSIDVG